MANPKVSLISFFLFSILIGFQLKLAVAQDYQLVWSDEFDSSELDLSGWEYMIGTGTNYGLPAGWGNNEWEYYRKENATALDGYLTITAKREPYQGCAYTSARIRTKDKGDWKYGKFELRARMPIGQGLWPALWMMPTDEVYGGWAASGEIDITEYLGHEPNRVHGVLHFGGGWPNNTYKGNEYVMANGSFHDDFHTFTLEWEEGKIQWFVDGELYQTQTSWWSSGGSFPAPFDQRFHLLINLAVGGNWPGYPDASTEFPQELVIEYVRVYQKGTAVQRKQARKPAGFSLKQNYPNPFNSATVIAYELSEFRQVQLIVYDLQGRTIEIPVDQFQAPGSYSVHLDGSDLCSGVYIYRLTAGNECCSRKLLLMK